MARDELLAVYDNSADARAAVRTLESAGINVHQVRIDDGADRVSAERAEMRSEIDRSIAPKAMVEGSVTLLVLGAIIGALVALPFAAIPFGDLGVWSRIATVSIVGVVVGGTAGWVIGGGFGPRRAEEPLVAETGATLALPATPEARDALIATHPRRIDVISEGGNVVSTVEEPRQGRDEVIRDIGRHMGSEDRRG